ncbi:hypothetical protein E2C01_049766 [Portunus trituberculatus]|uniref:Uncharacterized protein n=1 Tax=Portunus trituberculatus TaxID=210409 RepID=A0A5B7GAC0_PORTR|nr:hypothetical protein [Portunus trituberculatus]
MWKTELLNVPQTLTFYHIGMSCLSIISIQFTNLFIVIRSPLSSLSFKVGNCISFTLSSYGRSFISGTIFVAVFWILSSFLMSFCLYGDQTNAAYSSLGLTIVIVIFFHHTLIHVIERHPDVS